MRILNTVFVVAVVGALTACSSPEKKAAQAAERSATAQAKVSEERLKMVDQYKACVSQAEEDAAKVEACDHILKAIESLK